MSLIVHGGTSRKQVLKLGAQLHPWKQVFVFSWMTGTFYKGKPPRTDSDSSHFLLFPESGLGRAQALSSSGELSMVVVFPMFGAPQQD